MHPVSSARRVGRRLGVLLLALLTTCGLLDANATPAHAQTLAPWTQVTWDVENLAYSGANGNGAQRYLNLINNIRGLAGEHIGNGTDRQNLWETEGYQNRFIEVRVTAYERHFLSLYFRTNDMYLVGIAAGGRRYQFSRDGDGSPLARAYRDFYRNDPAPDFQTIGYSENYAILDPNQQRATEPYTPRVVYSRLNRLGEMTRANANTRRLDFAYVAQLTSEAVRFDWIRDRIFQTLRDGVSEPDDQRNQYDHVGSFGVALENNWTTLSTLVYHVLYGGALVLATVDGRVYRTIRDILRGGEGLPRIGGFLANSKHRGA
ncbi:ribosome-inactivating family protein [Streptomyces sp. NPDC017056]|uniref:ribosome-inactivating family protein n=1 Tax=Streptomyces sp. NPDC017056 TaxID=3364973 RepID=UPI00378AB99D